MTEDEVERDQPIRTLLKQEAIRHLVHSAIRLIIAMEDPFAVHMLIQSADKLLIDVAKGLRRPLHLDWERILRPERKAEFFQRWRETYNYFKHADRDLAEELPVYDITQGNLILLVAVIANYEALYGHQTDHMRLHMLIVQVFAPNIFLISEETKRRLDDARKQVIDMTLSAVFRNIDPLIDAFAPEYYHERSVDLVDAGMFYRRPMSHFQ